MTQDAFEIVTAIMRPLPDRDAFAAVNDHLDKSDLSLVFGDVLEQAQRERASFQHDLQEAAAAAYERDEEFDPVLETIDDCRATIDAAEHRLHLLLAYGREFVRPQPYQLKDLARAAGLSISGVRIAYDQDEVREVTELTGLKPRRDWSESA
jgi:hypothetical protein